MWTDEQIDAAAAAAAEKANGGRFNDPLFYKPEHHAFWRDVVRTALDVAEETPRKSNDPNIIPEVTPDEVGQFADHCVHIRSVFEYARRLFSESSEPEQAAMKAVAPHLFEDTAIVFQEFLVNAVCRITDPPTDHRGNENFTIGLFANAFMEEEPLYAKLDDLRSRMMKHRYRVLAARNKLGAHADRATIKKGEPLGAAKWEEWDQFWSDLNEFVSAVHERVFHTPSEIKASGVRGDAEMLLKKLQ